MDADGEIEIPVEGGKHLAVDIIGKNFAGYDAMINLAHFKGHPMGGFGGALKNQSIGIASSVGKVYIHTAGKSRDLEKFLHCFDEPEDGAAMTPEAAELLPPQDDFLESMVKPPKQSPTITLPGKSRFSTLTLSIIFPLIAIASPNQKPLV